MIQQVELKTEPGELESSGTSLMVLLQAKGFEK